jgi:hypothetical protein
MGEGLAMVTPCSCLGRLLEGGLWGHGQDTQSVNLLFLIMRAWRAYETTYLEPIHGKRLWRAMEKMIGIDPIIIVSTKVCGQQLARAALLLRCSCNARAMLLPCVYHALAMILP